MMVLGGVFGGLSWLLQWAALQYEWPLAYWQLLLIVIGQGHFADAADKAAIYVMAVNFPRQRGAAIGFIKALVGLSAALTAAACEPSLPVRFSPDHLTLLLWWCGQTLRATSRGSWTTCAISPSASAR